MNLERRLAAGPPGAPPDAATVTRRADRAGLLDLAYAVIDSPLGSLVAAATPRGIVALRYARDGVEQELVELAARVSPRILAAPQRLEPLRQQLEQYFAGRRRRFDVPLDWSLTAGFTRRVLEVTARIPYGEVATYAQVAATAGHPRAPRAAGNALGANPLAIVVPCHRVVRSGGAVGGYTGGGERKHALLRLEGALDAR